MADELEPLPEPDYAPAPSGMDTWDIQTRIISAIGSGASLRIAAAFAGVSHQSCRNWHEKGRELEELQRQGKSLTESEQRYVQFFTEVERRKARTIVEETTNIRRIARDNDKWEASWKLLTKLDPDTYGDKVEVHTEHSGTVHVETPISIERYRDLAKAMQEANLPLAEINQEILEAEIVEEVKEA